MRLGLAGGVFAIIIVVAAIVGYSTLFTVNQTQQALVVRLGKPVRVITEPGLNVKVPFIDSVIYVDKRILNIESAAQEITLSSQDSSSTRAELVGERLVVDAFARYRITDPLKYYQTVGLSGADAQLAILLNSSLRSVLGAATLSDVVRDKREELMAKMRDQIDLRAKPYGIEVIDVRIRRADLPPKNSQAVYQRMQTERQREAAEFRAQGSQKSQEIRARADRDVTVLLGRRQVAGRAGSRPGRQRKKPHLRRRVQSRSGLLRILPLDAGLREGAAAAATPVWCCGRIPTSSATSPVRRASRRRPRLRLRGGHSLQRRRGRQRRRPLRLKPSRLSRRRLNRRRAPFGATRASNVGFSRRDRPRLRDRGPHVRGLSAGHQARHRGCAYRAGWSIAHRRHRLGRDRGGHRLAGAGLNGFLLPFSALIGFLMGCKACHAKACRRT